MDLDPTGPVRRTRRGRADQGYRQRWGLIHVDFDTLVRTPKASATWDREVIRRNGL